MRQQIKLIKLQHISQTVSEKEIRVQVGDINQGEMSEWPEVGKYFTLTQNEYLLRTTKITQIIDDRTFKTKNSIYKIVTVEDERDEKIKIILE